MPPASCLDVTLIWELGGAPVNSHHTELRRMQVLKMIRSSQVTLPSLLCNWQCPSEDKGIKSVAAVFPVNHKKKKNTSYWQQEKLYAKLTGLQTQAWHEREGLTHPKSSFRPPLGLLNGFVSALAVPGCRQGVATHSHTLTRAQKEFCAQ